MAEFYGYEMDSSQADELAELLRQDILDRYDNDEYWEDDIIEDFALEHKLKAFKAPNISLPINFSDLTKKAQDKVLKFYDYGASESNNLGIAPLFTLKREKDGQDTQE